MSLNRTLAGLIDTAGDVKSASLDNVSAGLTVYATLNDLPTTGLTSGDQAYVSATSRFYISNGSGWYNVALVNATPNLTISPTGEIELSTEGATTTITLTGTDSDYPDANLTYSVESDGNFGGLATISQDSSVFTITPLSEDSATTESSTLTFKASDGISFGSGTSDLTLRFSISNSRYSISLLKADTSFNDNQADASSNSLSITEYGNVTSAAFSPYHPGGYSTYFDGSDVLIAPTSSDFTYGTGDFTLECWVYLTSAPTEGNPAYRYILAQGHNTTVGCGLYIQENNFRFYTGGVRVLDGTASGTQYALNQWQHVAVTRSGTTMKLFVDGVEAASGTSSNNITTGTSHGLTVGRWHEINDTGYWLGYIRDVRVVKGTAVYTSAFTPPTAALTAITNTSLLACHLPYIADGSTSDHTLSTSGTPRSIRFTPYDYQNPYSRTSHAGSVLFDGEGDYMDITTTDAADFGTGDFTVEVWWYPRTPVENGVLWAGFTNATNTSNNVCEFYLGLSTGFLKPHVNTNYSGTWTTRISTTEFCFDRTWNHVAYVRNGNTGNIYINGKKGPDYSINAAAQFNNPFSALRVFRSRQTTDAYGKGDLADLRIVKGTAVYTADFTPPTTPLTAITNTSLLTCTNKNDIWDASGMRRIEKVNSIAASGTKSGWTGNAIYFNRGSSQYMTLPQSDALVLGTGDFTIETWVYFNTVSDYGAMFDFRTTGTQVAPLLWAEPNNYFYWYINGSTRIQSANGSVATNTWYHVAVARSNSVTKMFVNGTQAGSDYADTNNYLCSGSVYIGRSAVSDDHHLNGYLIDARVTKGLARYTSNFTPPTTDFEG